MNEAHMRSYYTTYNSENADALRAFYADDVVLVSAQGEVKGVEAMIDTYRYLTGQFYDRMTPLAIEVNGDKAVVTISDKFVAKHDVADFLGQSLKQGESFELKLRGTYTAVNSKFTRIVIETI